MCPINGDNQLDLVENLDYFQLQKWFSVTFCSMV